MNFLLFSTKKNGRFTKICQFSIVVISSRGGGGGGGVSESMDGRECAILALELVPKNLIFA